MADPPPLNFTTTSYNPVGPTLISIAGHPFFGNLSGNVLPDGTFSFSLMPPTPAILGTDVSGTVTELQITGDYTVIFPDKSTAVGTILATVVPEPSAGGLLATAALAWAAGRHRLVG
jgi:hypothetical protein